MTFYVKIMDIQYKYDKLKLALHCQDTKFKRFLLLL